MKKTASVLLVLALVCCLALAGCTDREGTSSGGGTVSGTVVKLKVWGAQEDQALLQRMIDAFKAANTDRTFDITLGVVGEKDTKTKVLEDPAAAADVFSFSNDQLYDLVNAGALYEITRNRESIMNINSAGSVEAAMKGEKLYAYPMTADNGYFLYYDKSVLDEEDVQTLDGILAAANEANKKFLMAINDGWYTAGFFLGAGCTIGLDENGRQTCDFNSETGVKVGEAIKELVSDPAFINGDDSILTGGMGSTICAGVSGTWNAEAIQNALGENYGAVKLPTFTLGGEQKQMGSFAGYKLIGVNSGTRFPVEAMMLAEWLTNEENQLLRFEERAMGPSNINAAQSEEVQANLALAALAAQSQYATSQKEVLGGLWEPMKAFGTAMVNKDFSTPIPQMLDTMVAQITA